MLVREAIFSYNDTKVASRDTLLVLRSRGALVTQSPGASPYFFPITSVSFPPANPISLFPASPCAPHSRFAPRNSLPARKPSG